MTDYFIPEPPREHFFHGQTAEESVYHENLTTYVIEKIVRGDKGIEVYYKDTPFPRKGWPFGRAVVAVNIVKRLTTEFLKLYPKLGLLTLSPIRTLEKLLVSFNTISSKLIAEFVIKKELMTPCSSELQTLTEKFLTELGVSHETSVGFARYFSTLIEYDNAYRYRIEDICSETNECNLYNSPVRETKRLFQIYRQREKCLYITDTLAKLVSLASLILLIPKIKHTFRYAILQVKWERLRLDDADKYWCRQRPDYDFWGESVEVRTKDHVYPQSHIITKRA